MKEADEERIAARLAKSMAIICVRNTCVEDLHAGTLPVTHTGNFSEVFFSDADGLACPHRFVRFDCQCIVGLWSIGTMLFRVADGYFAADHTSLWGCKIG